MKLSPIIFVFTILVSNIVTAQNQKVNPNNTMNPNTLDGQWKIKMDVFLDGKVAGDGNEDPTANCLLTIKEQTDGSFVGTFSASPLANKSVAQTDTKEVYYFNECPVKDMELVGQIYNHVTLTGVQYPTEGDMTRKKMLYNGVFKNNNELHGSFFNQNCMFGDFIWERVSETPKPKKNAPATVAVPLTANSETAATDTIAAAPKPEKKYKADCPKCKLLDIEQAKARKLQYKVEDGDTLYGIARKYNTTTQQIRSTNILETDEILVGQTLWID